MNRPEINVTPLIDVLLVLLIIFMVVSPLKPTQFEAKIPQPTENEKIDLENPDTLVVVINTDGSLALNRDYEYGSFDELPKLTSDLLAVFEARGLNETRLSKDTASAPNRTTVFVKAPRSMNYGSVITVIDSVKLGGADPVSLQIDGLID